ncbi:hypothetical protein [Cupriavidus sp. H39]|uniref:hypothetical protein n=1 Tax=Cupriavidus sp. H39 TaxID=3401635 RepID=UPI003D053298
MVIFVNPRFIFLTWQLDLKPSDFRGILQKGALAGIIQIDESQKKNRSAACTAAVIARARPCTE